MGKKIFLLLAVLAIILIALAVYFVNPFQKQQRGGLQVTTDQESSTLFLNDQYLDKTPYINRVIQPGHYSLQIIPDNKELAQQELPIVINSGVLSVVHWIPGKTTQESGGIIFELEPIADKKSAEVQVVSYPNNAIVQFANQEQQFAPYLFRNVDPGLHSLYITLPGFVEIQQKNNVVAGYRLTITAYLAQESTESIENQSTQNNEESIENSEAIDESTAQTNLLEVTQTNYFVQEKEVLRVRDQPSAEGKSIGLITVNQTYQYHNEQDGWYYVSFSDAVDKEEKEGWISGQFIELISPNLPETNKSETTE